VTHQVELDVPGGPIWIETGRVARQASGAVVVRHRDTVLLATAVAASEPRPGQGFFPLTVEYRERMAASGRIPGSYLRREGRITDREVLVSRLADRTVRPLFPDGFLCDTQVMLTVLSADADVEPEGLAILGASAALHVSEVPWHGPVAGARIARADGRWHVFPSRAVRERAELDLVVSSGPQGLVMVEGEAREVGEDVVTEALARAEEVCHEIGEGVDELRREGGRDKREHRPRQVDEQLAAAVRERLAGSVEPATARIEKRERRDALAELERDARTALAERWPDREEEIAREIQAEIKGAIRRRIAREGRRPDGRGPEEIRAIGSEVSWLPRCHGSAIFTRGETQALVSCTLGTRRDEQRHETLEGEQQEAFLLHYNFPPYSVGETRPLRGPGRREIGHGNLAHRALRPLLPDPESFPYTIRLVSDISESNGSSSMATVCGGSLALMDAGVPLPRAVAGIAMGLIREGDEHVVLSDILGDEDHLGDMDFKVAGTAEGITAIQMDNKLGSIPAEVMTRALEQARRGREHILARMGETLEQARPEIAEQAPRVRSLRIRPERIGDLIGPGGQRIQEIQSLYDCRIDVSDDGAVRIYAQDATAARHARERVEALTLVPEQGKVYRGRVVMVRDFFAVVRLGETEEGRLHVSELDNRRVPRVQDVLSEGDEVLVRVQGVDDHGRIVLSRKAALGADESEVVI
jgi:polyribonucleotide nucleotidyltransferase